MTPDPKEGSLVTDTRRSMFNEMPPLDLVRPSLASELSCEVLVKKALVGVDLPPAFLFDFVFISNYMAALRPQRSLASPLAGL